MVLDRLDIEEEATGLKQPVIKVCEDLQDREDRLQKSKTTALKQGLTKTKSLTRKRTSPLGATNAF